MYNQLIEEDKKQLLKEKNKLNTIRAIRLLLFVFIGYLVYQLFLNGYDIILIIGLIISTGVFSILINTTHSLTKKVKILKYEIEFSERELSKTSSQYHSNGSNYIDTKHDYTYDLDVFGEGSIFHFINRTHSIIAERRLANYFIKSDLSNIKSRQKSVEEISRNILFRKRLYAIGLTYKFNADSEMRLLSWINKERKPLSRFYIYISVLSPLIVLFSLIGIAISTHDIFNEVLKYATLFNLLLLGINFKRLKSEIFYGELLHSTLFNLSDSLKLIEETNFNSDELNILKSKLSNNSKTSSYKIEQLGKIYQNIYNVQNLLSAILFNALFLQHIRTLLQLDRWIHQYRNEIPNLLDVIAEIEAICSLGNFKFNNPNFVFPEISSHNMIEMKDIGHPLIDEKNVVLNSISINESEFKILTGSNMSGKSTFLRSIGINLVLANMGSVCFAKLIKYKPIKLITSMRNNDSVLSKESYFMAEVNRLKYVFESIKIENVFLLLDEILKGTNSDDKLEGSKLILRKLVELNQQGIIATHDLELCNMEKEYPNRLQNICFESEIINNTIHFDYKLNVGICKNRSASFLIQKNIL